MSYLEATLRHASVSRLKCFLAALSGPTVKVKFELQRQCHFGQQFNVVGDDAQFGNWEPTAAIPMNWSAGHVWSTEVVSTVRMT